MSFTITFSVKVLGRCGAQTSRSPSSALMPAWLFVEGRGSGICKQLSQITTPSTTNVTSSGHRPINIAIKIRCQDDCISSLYLIGISAKSKHQMSESHQAAIWSSAFCPAPDTPLLTQPVLHQLRCPFLFFTLWSFAVQLLSFSSFLFSPFPFLLA